MARSKASKNETEAHGPVPCNHLEEHFNLIEEPWIPVVWRPETQGLPDHAGPDASPSELGLRDTLLHGHEIAEVADASPLVTAALYRLLIALVHAIYRGPEKRKDWVQMWRAGAFDTAKVCAYFDGWYDRFWLFHPERPFMQWPGHDLGNPVPSTLLNIAVASTSDATLFDHTLDADRSGFTYAETARQLMAFLAFKPGGFVEGVPGDRREASALAAPWADGTAFLALDKDLFATLMMNLMLPASRAETVSALGVPEWERLAPSPRTPATQGQQAGPPPSYLELLTAPCRHVRLCSLGPLGLVQDIRLQLGCVFIASAPVDPAKAYYADKKLGWRPLPMRVDRSLWRDSAALLDLSSKENVSAGSLAQLASLREEEMVPADLVIGLRAFGTIGSQAKVDLWRAETLPIPIILLGNPERLTLIENCLALAEEVENALHSAVWVLVCGLVPRSKKEKDRKALRDHLDVVQPYWTSLETPFKRDVLRPSASVDCEEVRRQWGHNCMALALEVLDKALVGLTSTGATFRAGAHSQRTLFMQLKNIRDHRNLN